jgi:DNA-directed RNA polymerase subunit beta'
MATDYSKDITNFDAVRLSIASPERILSWSHGEVLKPETINYRTQKPERDGLFCERIFGPVKNINPNDPKWRGVRTRDLARDDKGEIITKSIVRRERMGHISLAAPVSHIWFLRGTPSAIGLQLNMTVKSLEKIVYFASYIMTAVNTEGRDQMLRDLEAQTEAAKAAISLRYEKEAADEGADVKALAKLRTQETEELTADHLRRKAQLDGLEKKRLISETEYRELPEEYRALVTVGMGAKALKDLLDETDLKKLIDTLHEEAQTAKGQRRKKIIKRLKVLEGMYAADIKPSSLIVTIVPVIPPDLRPMVQLTGGRFATSDLNDLYRRVINRNNRLKKLIDLKAPEVIRRNEMRMLQEAVDALIDNGNARSGRAVAATGGRRRLKSLADMLKGKQGRFRQNLLGKRVDYSGRSVIVSGPDLRIDECGLPKMMALELFKPFVIGNLIDKELAHNIRSASRMIEMGLIEVWDALDEVIHEKYVLLNRAPTLHRLSVQAFRPRLIEGKAIQLHPLVCKGFNADFDGDMMAVHLPLSAEAQREARDMMTPQHNLLRPTDGAPVMHLEQDIVLGLYYLTYEKPGQSEEVMHFSSYEEALMAYEKGTITLQGRLSLPFRGEVRATTLGRVIFNEVFPDTFPFQDAAMSKKELKKVMALAFSLYGQEESAELADAIKTLGFTFATHSGLSIGISDFIDIEGMDELIGEAETRVAEISGQFEQGFVTDEERYRLTVRAWLEADNLITRKLEEQFVNVDNTLSMAAISGARGSIGQMKQATGMVGVVVDAVGREIELPIRSNYKRGFSTQEYFIATRGARKGLIDTALKTADSGYLTRKLVDVSQDVFTIDNDEADDPGLVITKLESEERGLDFAERIMGRVLAEAVKVDGKTIAKKEQLLDIDAAKAIVAAGVEQVRIYSVLTTRSIRGIPPKSYGADLATGRMVASHQPVGVIAAQSIGEPGTQLTLDTKHAHGAAAEEDVTQGLPRVEELFEARTPKGQAYVSEVDGVVSVREETSSYIVQVTSNDTIVETVELGGLKAAIKSGATVSKGDVIATDENAKHPVVAPFDAVADVTKKAIRLTSTVGAVARYQIPNFRSLVVADGDSVKRGERLTTGSLHLQELMRLTSIEDTQAYIMSEIQKIFSSQGQAIADKHLEVVVRQMFSRVHVDDPGDSQFVIGDIVSRAAVIEKNVQLLQEKKTPIEYTQLLLGIAKVATWSDSFLSAASFQDTTRVLISAATSGRVDRLYGLKENVIIGRKIPVGTGAPGYVRPADPEVDNE